jgi:hypothetical protein
MSHLSLVRLLFASRGGPLAHCRRPVYFTVPPIFSGRRDIADCFRGPGAAASLRYFSTWAGTGSI